MTSMQWIGIAALAVLFIVVGFAFRQGMKVKPDKDKDPFGGMPPGARLLEISIKFLSMRRVPLAYGLFLAQRNEVEWSS